MLDKDAFFKEVFLHCLRCIFVKIDLYQMIDHCLDSIKKTFDFLCLTWQLRYPPFKNDIWLGKKYRMRNNFPTGYFENPVGISEHLQELYFPKKFISDNFHAVFLYKIKISYLIWNPMDILLDTYRKLNSHG